MPRDKVKQAATQKAYLERLKQDPVKWAKRREQALKHWHENLEQIKARRRARWAEVKNTEEGEARRLAKNERDRAHRARKKALGQAKTREDKEANRAERIEYIRDELLRMIPRDGTVHRFPEVRQKLKT